MSLCASAVVVHNFKPIIFLRGLLLKVKSNEKGGDKIRCSSRVAALSALVMFYLVAIWYYAHNLFWPLLLTVKYCRIAVRIKEALRFMSCCPVNMDVYIVRSA